MTGNIDSIVDARIVELLTPMAEVVNDLQTRPAGKADTTEIEAKLKKLESELEEAKKAMKPSTVIVKFKTPKDGTTETETHPDVPKLISLLNQKPTDRNIYLWGEAGSGKTHAAKQLADILKAPIYISGTAMTKYDHLGFKLPTGDLVRTSFVDAWEHGGVCILDDNDRSEAKAMAALNAATANGDADLAHLGLGRVERHPDCILIVTGNTPMLGGDSKFAAAGKQDAAFRDRFLFWQMHLDESFELKLCPNPDWTRRVQRIRKAVKEAKGNIEQSVLCTMRASFHGAGLFADKILSQAEIEECCIFKGVGEDMKNIVYAKAGKPSTVAGKLINFE